MQASAMFLTRSLCEKMWTEREDPAEKQPQRPERQRDQPVAERRADVGAHDHADRRVASRGRRS